MCPEVGVSAAPLLILQAAVVSIGRDWEVNYLFIRIEQMS
jgi:hypothetical protein